LEKQKNNNRISLSKLQNKNITWGLEAPNFHHYLLANQLQYLVKWINLFKHNYLWLELGQNQCTNIPVEDLPFLSQFQSTHHLFYSDSLVENDQITKSSLELNPTLEQPRINDTEQTFISPCGHKKESHIFTTYLRTTISCHLTHSYRNMGLGGNNSFIINNVDF